MYVELPPPNTRRWVIRRKAAVVAAVRAGDITLEEACRRYQLSEAEFLSWQRVRDPGASWFASHPRPTAPKGYLLLTRRVEPLTGAVTPPIPALRVGISARRQFPFGCRLVRI